MTRILRRFSLPILHRYLLRQFVIAFLGSLLAFTALFVVFDFFEQIRVFIREDSTLVQALSYLFFRIPLVVHLMTPMAVLIGTLISIGRLSQLSEITAMRACGVSVTSLTRPLLGAGVVISILVLIAGETIVPWATDYVEELYHVDIRKKVESGGYSRENFWYRSGDKFYNIGFYDSRRASLSGLSVFELDSDFRLLRRVDAEQAEWVSPRVGWSMKDVVEMTFDPNGSVRMNKFNRVPLVIKEKPADFYNMRRMPEAMSYFALLAYVDRLRSEGVPVTKYLVDLASKLSFPFVNVIAILIAVPFALTPARSGSMTKSFVGGISVGFAYHFTHALMVSFGAAELLPVLASAWAANVIFACLGTYLLAGAEYAGR